MSQHVMNTYVRLPVTFAKGEGVWLWDDKGEKYLDALSGIAVTGLGHSHPDFVKAISEQAATLMHVSNVYHIAEQKALADKLADISGMDSVFFCNSGCEANEAQIKLARLYAYNKGIDNPEIIVMEQSFHGRTLATLSATGSRKAQAGFEPLVSGFVRVPFDDVDAIKQVAARKNNVVAILVEPVQGEGGVQVPADMNNYITALRKICDDNEWLLMLDEVQSGIARTGTWFAFQHTDVMPDSMALAKGLGSGVPIGACLAKGAAAEVLTPGKHGSTFGGNPFATKAGSTTLAIIEKQKLRENAKAMGDFIHQQLAAAFEGNDAIVNIRHAGLMIGVELDRPCAELVKLALDNKLLINVTADKVIRLLPPLVINQEEAQELVNRLVTVVEHFIKTSLS
ncbi:MAG: acetylornithine/N-succinyldiaminopimelate aminotransferase [Methylophilaceae bacterium]|jgi:acetylornithine/N-succinyldiaminopimelate aminotransferase